MPFLRQMDMPLVLAARSRFGSVFFAGSMMELMMDWCAIESSDKSGWTQEFRTLGDALENGELGQPDTHYVSHADLRTYGYPAHIHFRSRETGRHKITLHECSTWGYSALCGTINRILDCDPSGLRIMRTDMCSDIEDVPVSWFEANARWKRKNFTRLSSGETVVMMGVRSAETIYSGRGVNKFRVYNKEEEWFTKWDSLRKQSLHLVPDSPDYSDLMSTLRQDFQAAIHEAGFDSPGYKVRWDGPEAKGYLRGYSRSYMSMIEPRAKGKAHLEADIIPFEQWVSVNYHREIKHGETVLTRCEREMGAGRVPEQLLTLSRIKQRGLDYNPFAPLQILPTTEAECQSCKRAKLPDLPSDRGQSNDDLLRELGWSAWVAHHGGNSEFASRSLRARDPERNSARIFRKLQKSLFPVEESGELALVTPISERDVYDSYRESLRRQLAA
jgi:hypothetical protein